MSADFPAIGAEARPEPQKESAKAPVLPVLCGGLKEVPVTVDLNADTATTQLQFCTPVNTKTVEATLSAGDFTSRMTQMGLGAKVLFTVPKATTGSATAMLQPINPGETLVVKADLAQIWEAGEAAAPLRINGVEAAKLVAAKYRLPFGVKVDAPDPDRPAFVLPRDRGYAVVLKNEDPVTYRIHWNFAMAGKTSSGDLMVTPKSTATFTLNAEPGYFQRLTGLLKDHEEDGKLTLGFSPSDGRKPPYWPSKVIPVKVHLRYASEVTRSGLVNGLLFLVLVAGALFSYLASVGLPNRLKRSEYREDLGRLGQRIGGISHQVDSRLRVVVRVQCKRLNNLLNSRTNISPDLTRVFNQVSQGMAALEKQVALAEQIDAAHRRLQYLDGKGAPPSLLTAAEDAVWKAGEEIGQLSPEEAKLERSKACLEAAAALMDKAEEYNEDFAKGLPARAKQIQTDLTPYVETPLYRNKLLPALPGILADLTPPVDPPKTLEAAVRLDQSLTKRNLVRQFLQIHSASQHPEILSNLDAQLERLIVALGLESYKAIRHARLLVREAQEGVYPDDIVKAGAGARIEIDPVLPQTNDPVRFRIRFPEAKLNDAAARLEFEGCWNFGHNDYSESGWEPVHYFPRREHYDVSFRCGRGTKGEEIKLTRRVSAVTETESWWKRDRNRAEVLRFSVTLLPAIVGLLSGAREQFLKMDVWSALFAVFLLGFASDTVKNLVSHSEQAPAPPAKPANPAPPAAKPDKPANAGAKS
jgi:hypothetical protein